MSGSATQPVNISQETLNQLTVPEIKIELQKRSVSFPAKLRKQSLLDLLMSSLHLPLADNWEDAAPAPKSTCRNKAKRTHWKGDQPTRRLLYFEFKEGNSPLDPNEMGPAEIHCKCSDSEEFQGVPCDDTFVLCLKSLRQQIMKEESLLQWNELHPARKLLFDELEAGTVPMDATQMSAAEVWCKHAATPQFKMRGMKFGDTFKRRLSALRKLVKRDKSRADDDKDAAARAIRNHPPPTHNHRGEPQWNGSKAQALLKEDIANDRHLENNFMPSTLRMDPDRPQHQECSQDTFRWKMQQEIRTKKHLHTLKFDAEQKLRKNLKKMSLVD